MASLLATAQPEDSADESNLMEEEISELDETVKAPVSTFDQQVKPIQQIKSCLENNNNSKESKEGDAKVITTSVEEGKEKQ